MITSSYKHRLLIILFPVCFIIGKAGAAPPSFDSPESHAFSVEMFRTTHYESPTHYQSLSSSWFLGANVSMTESLYLRGELPISYVGAVSTVTPDGERTYERIYYHEFYMGNPFVGVQNEFTHLSAELGVRLPLMLPDHDPDSPLFMERFPRRWEDPTTALFFGAESDPDRMEAFMPHTLTLSGKVQHEQNVFRDVFVRIHGGPTLRLPSRDRAERPNHLLLDYGVESGIRGSTLSLIASASGRFHANDNIDTELNDRFLHQIGLRVNLDMGTVSPGIQYRNTSFGPDNRDSASLWGVHVTLGE